MLQQSFKIWRGRKYEPGAVSFPFGFLWASKENGTTSNNHFLKIKNPLGSGKFKVIF